MPPKAEGPRWRYIAFEIGGGAPFSRGEFLDALLSIARNSAVGDRFRITVFEGDFGIVKVPHYLKQDMIEALVAVESVGGSQCKVATLKTSGTIKTLKQKYKGRISKDSGLHE